MKKVRLGLIGLGNMGTAHARSILQGATPKLTLAAVADTDPGRRIPYADNPDIRVYETGDQLIAGGEVDAVLIATPHYSHTTLGIAALEKGLHVLVEKPISVHKADCEKLIAAHKRKSKVFAAMFNQRTDPHYIKVRNLIRQGELGEIRRVNWIITNWFRPNIYYASGGWRATWAGEGGGVLLNQCPHNLDLFQWMFGMPVRVRAFCSLGRYHDIEVEDDVTAYFEFKNGATGCFITSTGEAPGTNRLEITAERGKVVCEGDHITFTRNEVPMSEFSDTTTQPFSSPPTWEVSIPVSGHGGQHNEILNNFADAILQKATLIAPAKEGIHSVELANAILFSSLQGKTVELPLNARAFKRQLDRLIAGSKTKKKVVRVDSVDFASSQPK